MTSPVMHQYRSRRETFRMHPSIGSAQALMRSGQIAWEAGQIGEATFVREVLEPVRDHLLAGNMPQDLQRDAMTKAVAMHDMAYEIAQGSFETTKVVRALRAGATMLEVLAGERTTITEPMPVFRSRYRQPVEEPLSDDLGDQQEELDEPS